MEQSVYGDRIRLVQEIMQSQGVDLFALGPSANLSYLTGYSAAADERLMLMLLPQRADPFVVINRLYQAPAEELPIQDLVFWSDGENPFHALAEEIRRRRVEDVPTLAVEPELPARFSLPLASLYPKSRLISGQDLTMPLRQRKGPEELERIRQGSAAADQALAALMAKNRYWIGKTEEDFADELDRALRRTGVKDFGCIAAAGAHAADPHHITSAAPIKDGECFLVDFWGTYQGYYTDCTRTFFFGSPSAEFELIHSLVLEAHLAAEAVARPGFTLGDVDAAARKVISDAGYGSAFTHRTGHGVGIEIHEGASASQGDPTPIAPGMVFSIEPGIYIPGQYGVRIENLVAIGPEGPEIMHQYPRELRIIC